jgi:hypothetical protein
MLTTEIRDKNITTQRSENQPNNLFEDNNLPITQNGVRDQDANPQSSAGAMIINVPSQLYQGWEWVRDAALELSKNLTKDGESHRDLEGVKHKEEIAVPLLDLMDRHDRIPKHTATLGFAEDGSTIFHNFQSKEKSHLLIVGGPDAGKTVMFRTIAISLALNNRQSEIQLAAISPIKGDEEQQNRQAQAVYALNYLPHLLCDIAFRHADILELLNFLSNEITYREKHDYKHPHLIVLIDQVDVLIERGGRRCAEPILKIAQKGEEVGIHLVLTAQSVDSRGLSTQLLTELPTRLIGRPSNFFPSQTLQLGREDDIDQLLGEGDFLYQQNGRRRRMQGGFISDQELLPKLIEMSRHRAILLAEPIESRLRLEVPKSKSRIKWPTESVDQVKTGTP